MNIMHNEHIALTDITAIAQRISHLIPPVRIITLTGPLGAGKTTLAGALLHQLVGDAQGPFQSPTYTYLNAYQYDHKKVYHFDLYRLHSVDDFIQAGFDDYLFEEDSICIIEWPEIIQHLITENVCSITLDYGPNDTRYISIKTN